MLAILAMLAPKGALRVAPGGSALPIPFVPLHGLLLPGRDGKAGAPIEQESWVWARAARSAVSRSGLSVTAPDGVQFRVWRLQRAGLDARAC